MITLPLAGGGLWLLFTVMEKYPQPYNYFNLSEANSEVQNKNGRRMLNVLKNEIVLFFGLISYLMMQIAKGAIDGIGGAFLPIYLVVIFGSAFMFWVVRM